MVTENKEHINIIPYEHNGLRKAFRKAFINFKISSPEDYAVKGLLIADQFNTTYR